MKTILFALIFILLILGCKKSVQNKNEPGINRDEILIKILVINVLKWHETHGVLNGFETVIKPGDSLVSGMNLVTMENEVTNLRKTGFFDENFLNNYRFIVTQYDKFFKNKEIELNSTDIPPYSSLDPWCMCQDSPDKDPWGTIMIRDFNIQGDTAEITWTWGDSNWNTNFNYKVKTVKVGGVWKISYLQGFDPKNILLK